MKKLSIVLLATAALAACGPTKLSEQQLRNAELGAVRYLNQFQADYASCSGQDSDNDGYVTCTGKSRVGNGAVEIFCSYDTAGCKRKG